MRHVRSRWLGLRSCGRIIAATSRFFIESFVCSELGPACPSAAVKVVRRACASVTSPVIMSRRQEDTLGPQAAVAYRPAGLHLDGEDAHAPPGRVGRPVRVVKTTMIMTPLTCTGSALHGRGTTSSIRWKDPMGAYCTAGNAPRSRVRACCLCNDDIVQVHVGPSALFTGAHAHETFTAELRGSARREQQEMDGRISP